MSIPKYKIDLNLNAKVEAHNPKNVVKAIGTEEFRKAAATLDRALESFRKKSFQTEVARIRKQADVFREAGLEKIKIEEFVQLSRARAFDQHARPAIHQILRIAA